MKNIKNKFGEGILYDESDLKGKIYATSAACMSVWSDFLSWANANKKRMVKTPDKADTIVVLGCQVTDLSVLNDLKIAEILNKEHKKDIFMGGCLSQRFDIELPYFIKRLDVIRKVNVSLNDKTLVHYEKPYWVQDFKDTDDNLKEGNLFRNMYPLKIGAGCHGLCKYCTIRHTRGETYTTDPNEQIEEFLNHENVVLISDSPTIYQIKEWCRIAIENNKEFSIRNIEPQTLVACEKELMNAAQNKVLNIMHCPIQSFDKNVLTIMNRSVYHTSKAVSIMKKLKSLGVTLATNIIIDYKDGNRNYKNFDKKRLDKIFDYYSWNPYFDGKWDYKKAEERMKKYITDK